MFHRRHTLRTALGAAVVAVAVLAPAAAMALPTEPPEPPEDPAPPRPPRPTPPPPNPNPTPPPPPTTPPHQPPQFRQPRYKLEAISTTVDDESGPDWPGNDEAIFVFTSKDGAMQETTVSQAFWNADSGETFNFTTGRCLVANCTTGVAGPLGLSANLVESDGGSEAEIREYVHGALVVVQWILKIFGVPSDWLDSEVENYLVSLFSDDLMGSANLVWADWELAQALPTVGSTYTETIHLGEHGGDLPSWIDNPPDYTLRLRLTRMPDYVAVLQP